MMKKAEKHNQHVNEETKKEEQETKVDESKENSTVWQQFVSVTSLHGLPDIALDYGKLWKITWFIVLLFGIAMCVRGIVMMFLDFSASPTAVQIKKRPNSTLLLPDLNICPEQGLIGSRLKLMGIDENLATGLSLMFEDELFLEFIPGAAPAKNVDLMKQWSAEFERYQRSHANVSLSEIITNASLKCEELIISCKTYAEPSLECCKDSSMFFNRQLRQCIRLRNLGVQTFPSNVAGLTLLLNLSLYDEDDLMTSSIQGIQVEVVRDTKGSSRNFIKMSPNTFNTMSITYTEIIRVNDAFQAPICKVRDVAATNISANGCFYRKWAEVVHEECGCVPLSYDAPGFRKCNLFEMQLGCMADVEKWNSIRDAVIENQKLCIPSCRSYQYDIGLTSSYFNSKLFESSFKRFKTLFGNVRKMDFGNFQSGAYLALYMYYPEMVFTETIELSLYSFDEFVSNIGGTLGLWLGASILSVFQAIAYFVLWLIKTFR